MDRITFNQAAARILGREHEEHGIGPLLDQLRQVVRNSETVETWHPNHTPEWEAAYQKLLTFL